MTNRPWPAICVGIIAVSAPAGLRRRHEVPLTHYPPDPFCYFRVWSIDENSAVRLGGDTVAAENAEPCLSRASAPLLRGVSHRRRRIVSEDLRGRALAPRPDNAEASDHKHGSTPLLTRNDSGYFCGPGERLVCDCDKADVQICEKRGHRRPLTAKSFRARCQALMKLSHAIDGAHLETYGENNSSTSPGDSLLAGSSIHQSERVSGCQERLLQRQQNSTAGNEACLENETRILPKSR